MNRLFLSVVLSLCLHSSFKIIADQITTCKQNPTCTEVGAFEIYDRTCKNYYVCEDDGEELYPIFLSCASSAIFDQIQGRCVPENTTSDLPTPTTPPSTTPPSTTPPSNTPAPICNRYGRFPISDVKCKKYYYCYWNSGHYDVMNNLTCPNTLVFNPTLEKCVSPQSYTCPNATVQ